MKCISIRQPSATLLARGITPYSCRVFRTYYQGPIALHARARFDRADRRACIKAEPVAAALKQLGYSLPTELPVRCILATAVLQECVRVTWSNRTVFAEADPTLPYRGLKYGRWLWVFTDVVPLPEVVPYHAREALFDIPDDFRKHPNTNLPTLPRIVYPRDYRFHNRLIEEDNDWM